MNEDAPVTRLDLHRFCPRCGAEPMQKQPPHLTVCPACDLHLYLNASAAVAAIIVDDVGRVLLIRRAHEPGRGKLAFPGGFVDNNETIEAALHREVREETGLELGTIEFLLSHPNIYPYRGVLYHTIDLMFVARLPNLTAAQPLDAVAELVIRPTTDVHADDLAFASMQAAWRALREKPPAR
jgi:NAD+ diphosphatase